MSFAVTFSGDQYTFTFVSGRVVYLNASEVNFQIQQNGLVWAGDGVTNITVNYLQCTSPVNGTVEGWVQDVIDLNVSATAVTLAPGTTVGLDAGANTIGNVNVNGTVPISGSITSITNPVSITGTVETNQDSADGLLVNATGAAISTLLTFDCIPNSTTRYLSVSMQVISTSGTILVEASNDNTNWVNFRVINITNATPTYSENTPTVGNIYYARIPVRYIRIRQTTFTAGTTNIACLFRTSIQENIITPVFQFGNAFSVNSVQVAASANLIGDVGTQYRANSTGAATRFHFIATAGTNARSIKGSAGRLLGYTLSNITANWLYVKFHFVTVVPTPGVNVALTVGLPPNSTVVKQMEGGVTAAGIGITTVTGPADADSVGIAANDIVGDIFYA